MRLGVNQGVASRILFIRSPVRQGAWIQRFSDARGHAGRGRFRRDDDPGVTPANSTRNALAA